MIIRRSVSPLAYANTLCNINVAYTNSPRLRTGVIRLLTPAPHGLARRSLREETARSGAPAQRSCHWLRHTRQGAPVAAPGSARRRAPARLPETQAPEQFSAHAHNGRSCAAPARGPGQPPSGASLRPSRSTREYHRRGHRRWSAHRWRSTSAEPGASSHYHR